LYEYIVGDWGAGKIRFFPFKQNGGVSRHPANDKQDRSISGDDGLLARKTNVVFT
jgi:hypothetical protein